MENILRERSDIAHLFGMWKLLNSSTQHGVRDINLNSISFIVFLAGFYKVIRDFKCPNFTAFCCYHTFFFFFFRKQKLLCKGTIRGKPITIC